ncbi:MAG: formate dehydrogenase subunit gamma [Hyphomicrobiaceae bacterium]|nr:formate dehydrogenase subunit gamma [Hyphomicrobiaceae bacterium]
MSRAEPWSDDRTRAIVARHLHREGPLLPILHDVLAEFGCVPEQAVPVIAEELNLSRAEVHGVVTFYHDFRRAPAGRHMVKMCRAEACQAMGAERLVAHAEKRLGVTCGETSADGRVSLEAIYCLGLCATGPAAMVDGRLVGRLDEQSLAAVLKETVR